MKAIMFASLLSLAVQASQDVCVRNFNVGGINPCENHSSLFGYGIATDKEMVFALCVKRRPGMCNGSPEFKWIEGAESGRICTVDYNQEVTGNFCESEKLQTFYYAKAAD